MQHVIRGKRHRILRPRLQGKWGDFCPGELRVHCAARDFDELYAFVHESLHAAYPDLSEEAVTEGSMDIAQLLWRLDYRRDGGSERG